MQRARSESSDGHRVRIAAFAIALLATAVLPLAVAAPASAATLDRVRETGKLTLGYRIDARPFSYKNESGKVTGYSVALCERIADQVKSELQLSALAVEWVPVTIEDRFLSVQQGKTDLLCEADTATLTRRKEVAFSIPIFPGGIGAVLRTDSPPGLQEVLSEAPPPSRPIWRGSPARTVLEKKTFSVVASTTSATWLASRLDKFEITATVAPVEGYEAGIRRVLDRRSDVFFGDRAILLDAANRSPSSGDLVVLDRLFIYEPLALTLARSDDDFRLIVDRTLSRLFASAEFHRLYVTWFNEPDESTVTFFRLNTSPE
jgi:polar amino acid transport system substrate-binding protein